MMSRIVIRSDLGSISIRTQGARINCQPGHYKLDMQGNGDVAVNLKTTPSQLNIDQSPSFASAGLQKSLKQNSEFSNSSLQKGMEKIGQIAQDGLQFLRIERGGSPIASQAAAKGRKEVQVVAKSVELPDISYTPGQVNISSDINNLQSTWQYVESSSEYTPGEITITLGVKPNIEIFVEPGAELHFPVSMGMGINVDEAI